MPSSSCTPLFCTLSLLFSLHYRLLTSSPSLSFDDLSNHAFCLPLSINSLRSDLLIPHNPKPLSAFLPSLSFQSITARLFLGDELNACASFLPFSASVS